jgi:hypothetical protein
MVDSMDRCNTIVGKVVWHGRKTRTEVDVVGVEERALEEVEKRRSGKSNLCSAWDETWASAERGAVEWWLCARRAKTVVQSTEHE